MKNLNVTTSIAVWEKESITSKEIQMSSSFIAFVEVFGAVVVVGIYGIEAGKKREGKTCSN
jgi:hypothetical protein